MYKKGQGMASRTGAAIIGLLLGFFAGYSWYYWRVPADAQSAAERILSLGFIGAMILFLGITLAMLHTALISPRSSDYLIDMDVELRKVVWPAAMPLFDPKTEAWKSTYIVIICTIVLSFYIWIVDMFLDFSITQGLFRLILFPDQ